MIRTSQETAALNEALAKAQGKIQGAHKDSANPFFKSKYADLASVWDACRQPLSENGLAIVQFPHAEDAKVTITTRICHASGQWMEADLSSLAKDATPQSIGSAMTYLRRYALQSVAGVAPEDDDGEAAQPQRPQAKPAAKKAEPNGAGGADPKAWAELKQLLEDKFGILHDTPNRTEKGNAICDYVARVTLGECYSTKGAAAKVVAALNKALAEGQTAESIISGASDEHPQAWSESEKQAATTF